MMTLSGIAFGAPAMFYGLALLSLPVAAHFLNRRAWRRVVFPTIVLLNQSLASQSQLFKLRRLLLLLLRCLAVALLAGGFARPIWRDAASASGPQRGSAMVLVLDVSASVGQRRDGVTALESQRAAAIRTLDGLARGTDVANVIFASARPQMFFPSLTANLDALRQSIAEAELSAERADLPAALTSASKLLAEHEGQRLLVIFSDLQLTNWSDIHARFSAVGPLPDGTQINVVGLPGPAPPNLSLQEPVVRPAAAVAQQTVQLNVKLVNFSDRQQTTRIQMQIDSEHDGPIQTMYNSVSLGPWQDRELSFQHQFKETGSYHVTFSIGADALEIDDRVYLAVQVEPRISVMVIGDHDPREPGTSSYFTVRALAPRDGGADRYKVQHLKSAQATGSQLSHVAAVFICDTTVLAPLLLEALHQYMLHGGGLVLLCGDGSVDVNLRALDKMDPEHGLSPWAADSIQGQADLASRGELLHLSDGDWRSSLLRGFDQRSQLALSRIRFGRIWNFGHVRPEARVLLKYSDGSIAMASRAVGAGKFVVANFSPAWGSSDLGKYGSFVALMQSLVEDLQPSHVPHRSSPVGQSLTFTNTRQFDPGGPSVRLTSSNGQSIDDFDSTSIGDKLSVTVIRPKWPGFYRVQQGTEVLGTAAVNIDPRESNLRRLDDDTLKQQLTTGTVDIELHNAGTQRAVVKTKGKPLWGLVLAGALIVIGLELALLAYWKR